jgi:hypothetical protein
MLAPMPDLTIGKTYSFSHIVAAYRADPLGGGAEEFFIVHRGDEIAALCLRHKDHPEPGEVWIAEAETEALWGERLAQCKDKKTVPLYYAPRGRNFYEFKGHHLITGESTDGAELGRRKSHVPLARVVFLKKA